MLRDPEFGPIRLRAFGTYAIKVINPTVFISELVGTDGNFEADDLTDQLRNIIVSRFTDKLGEAKVPALDLASNYDEIADIIHEKIEPEFREYGVELPKFLIENIALPPEVEEALDKRSSMGILGNLNQYTQYQAANAMEAAASNSGDAGGAMGSGMGMGMGFAMANQMGNAMAGGMQGNQGQAAAPPPPPGATPSNVSFHVSVNGQSYGPYDMNTFLSTFKQVKLLVKVWFGVRVWQIGNPLHRLQSSQISLGHLLHHHLHGSVPPPPPM